MLTSSKRQAWCLWQNKPTNKQRKQKTKRTNTQAEQNSIKTVATCCFDETDFSELESHELSIADDNNWPTIIRRGRVKYRDFVNSE